MIVITKHAFERGKERLGLNDNAFKKVVAMAFCYGVDGDMTKGELRRFILKRKHEDTSTRIYGDNVYIFRADRLVTVYQIPVYLKRYLKIK